MSERLARTLLAVVIVALTGATVAMDLPVLSGGTFWGDGATYYSMAWSLAEDGDLRFDAGDLLRARREFPAGPQGVFLKRSSGGLMRSESFPWLRRVPEDKPQIYYAKPFAYPLAVAPLVRLLGTRGMLFANALCLGVCLVLGYVELRRRASPAHALVASLVIFLASVAPVYLLWPTPELFNMALVAAGLTAWRRERPLLSAVLLGVATYSKPYNLWLAIPLGLAPLLSRDGSGVPRRLLESTRRGLALAAAVGMLFGLNTLFTGEWNYQGGRERKTFYEKFPGETEIVDGQPREVTFGNSGIWMSTNQLGPRVVGRDDVPPAQGAEPPRSAEEFRLSFVYNLAYFWVGRFGGVLPYFFPFLAVLLAFLVLGPRDGPAWLALAALAVSFLFYIEQIPDQWYGGSGTVGNRYFLNLLPLAVFLVPRGREALVAGAGLLGSALFVTPLLLSPLHYSLHHGSHATRAPFRWLPIELTMLNDLSIFSETWRKKQPIGDTEGDTWRHWPADPKAYYLYFPDDGTYGKERGPSGLGFWLRGGERAQVVLRALEPVRLMNVRITGGPDGDDVTIGLGDATERAAMSPGQSAEVRLAPGAGFPYKDSFVYVLELRSRRGRAAADRRKLGAFVSITLDVSRRSRP